MIRVVQSTAYEIGGCNFCSRHIHAGGETNHTVYEVQKEDGRGVRVRFCNTCIAELKAALPASGEEKP